MDKIIPMTVDLGDLGKHTLDFGKSFESGDLEKALREQPGNYDWYDSIYCRLKSRLDAKHNYLKETIAKRRSEIADIENATRTKAVSQKELDSLVEKDPEVLTVKEDITETDFQVRRISGHLTSLSQFHSILKELSKRERSSMLQHSDSYEKEQEEDVVERADKRVNKGRQRRE